MKKTSTIGGVTLIETMIYIVLFGIIIGGSIVAAYQIFVSSGSGQSHAMLEEEGDFMVGKINWVLSGAKTISAPMQPKGELCAESDTLSVSKWDSSQGIILIVLAGDDMTISRGGNPAVILNNSNTKVSGLHFVHCGNNEEIIRAIFILSTVTSSGATLSRNFYTTISLRK